MGKFGGGKEGRNVVIIIFKKGLCYIGMMREYISIL